MKDKSTAAILALFMGWLGIHKFYLGRIGAGVAYLVFSLTFIPAVLGLIDFIVLALMEPEEFDRRYNGRQTLPAPVVVNMLPPPYPPPGAYPYPHGMHPHAVPAAWGPPPQPVAHPPRSADELARELEKLNELRIAGLLTDEEFAAQKARLLAAM